MEERTYKSKKWYEYEGKIYELDHEQEFNGKRMLCLKSEKAVFCIWDKYLKEVPKELK